MHVESGWGKAKPARPEVQAAPQRRAMAYRATLEAVSYTHLAR